METPAELPLLSVYPWVSESTKGQGAGPDCEWRTVKSGSPAVLNRIIEALQRAMSHIRDASLRDAFMYKRLTGGMGGTWVVLSDIARCSFALLQRFLHHLQLFLTAHCKPTIKMSVRIVVIVHFCSVNALCALVLSKCCVQKRAIWKPANRFIDSLRCFRYSLKNILEI